MTINVLPIHYKKAFKDADIRGEYGDEINEELAYRIARGFVDVTGATKVAVGRDMRVSSPTLADAFCAGVIDAGAIAVDMGLVTTPMVYFMSGKERVHAVMITASHNPKQYNGFKLVAPGAQPLTGRTGLAQIQKVVAKNQFLEPKKRGKLIEKNVTDAFFAYLTKKVPPPKKRTVKIVVDAGNGMGTLLIPFLKQYAVVTPLFNTLDGTFPNRDSNPTLKKSQKAVGAALRTGSFDMGIAFDGDADRVAIFDEKGRYLNAAHVGALLVGHLLIDYPKSSFVYTVLTSRAYYDAIVSGGGKPVRARVGHAFIKETMRKHNALFGCEHSAHFYFKDNYFADSVLMPVLSLVQMCAVGRILKQPLSATIAPYTAYYQTEEVLVGVVSKEDTLQRVATWGRDNGASVKQFDGVTLDFGDWWTTVKKSVTEDALKFVVESRQKVKAVEGQKRVLHVLQLETAAP